MAGRVEYQSVTSLRARKCVVSELGTCVLFHLKVHGKWRKSFKHWDVSVTYSLWLCHRYKYFYLTLLVFCCLTVTHVSRVFPLQRTQNALLFRYRTIVDIDFHIGLPVESFHRMARSTGESGNFLLTLLRGLTSPINRQVMWAVLTGKTDFSEITESAGDTFEVGFRRSSEDEGFCIHRMR